MRRFDGTTFVLLIAIAAGLIVRSTAAFSRGTITHDESISYLSATGHQGEFDRMVEARETPVGWVAAAELKRVVRVEKAFVFKQIGHELAVHDFHPPLYFWLLHLWTLLVGVHVWSGQLLNALIAAVTAWVLFRFARNLLGDRQSAAIVTATWVLSPAVLLSSIEARAYDLFALMAVLLVAQVVRREERVGPVTLSSFLGLALTTAAGLLTHFHFAIVLAGSAVWLVLSLFRRDRRRLAYQLAAIAAGCGLFLLAHPNFMLSFRRFGGGDPFVMAEVKTRLNAVIATLTGFAVYGTLSKTIALLLIVMGLMWMMWVLRRKRVAGSLRLEPAVLPIAFFILWTTGAVVALYMAFRSPAHAMGPKYLSPVWPLMAFIPVLVARQVGSASLRVPAAVAVVIAAFGVTSIVHWSRTDPTITDPSAMLGRQSRVVINSIRAAMLPRALWHVPDTAMVYAADTKDLLKNPAAWVDHLANGGLYVNIPDFVSSPEQRRDVNGLLTERYDVTPVDGGIWELGQVSVVQPRPGGGAVTAGASGR
jgi:Dolichyl-phosphate-mannose-protein mannosyltransferase